MMKIKLVSLLLLVSFSNVIIGQNNDLDNFKKFLPYIIKGLQQPKPEKQLDENTSGVFQKPWEVKKLQDSEIQNIIKKIIDNKRFKVKKDYTGEWKLDFFSKLKNFESIEEIYKSNGALSNTFVQVSEIKILDEANSSAYFINKNKSIKSNESKKLNFNSGQVHTTFPIIKEYSNLNGSIKVTLKEYSKIRYKAFQKNDTDIEFNLGDIKNIKLLRIDKNKAYFILPKVVDNIEITSTNVKNETHSSQSISKIPKKVYDFATKDNLTDESINSFIKNLSKQDVYENYQMLIYETNGIIDNLYIYLKSNPIDLASKTIEIKL